MYARFELSKTDNGGDIFLTFAPSSFDLEPFDGMFFIAPYICPYYIGIINYITSIK